MYSICYKENLKIKPEQLVEIISSTNQDIRLVLNHLSMLAAKKEENMNFKNKEIKLVGFGRGKRLLLHYLDSRMYCEVGVNFFPP